MDEQIKAVISTTGEVFSAEGKRELPPKQWRAHRWIVVTSFVLSDEQAQATYEPGNTVLMDATNLWDMSVGCIDCEQPYPEVKDKRCNAPAYRG